MKTVLLGPLPPPYGGVSIYVGALAERLKGRGVRVWALCGDARRGAAGNVRFVNHRRLGVARALLAEGRGARILDASHFHFEHPHPLLLPLWLALKRALGFEWYKNVHDGSLPARHGDFGPVRRELFRLAAASVDEFVVVSEELARWLREEIKVTQRVTLAPSLLAPSHDADGKQVADATRGATDARAHLSEETARRSDQTVPFSGETARRLAPYLRRARRVCSVGVFTPEYGFAHAARAVERVREETGEDLGLALLDGTFARDEAYRAGVLRGRESWITVLEDVPNAEVYGVLAQSDAFVRAFAYESYGISRVEAIWCGVPVVATNAGETRGMLTYEFGDVPALVAQLRRALYDPPRAELRAWAETFRREAEANLRAVVRALDLE